MTNAKKDRSDTVKTECMQGRSDEMQQVIVGEDTGKEE